MKKSLKFGNDFSTIKIKKIFDVKKKAQVSTEFMAIAGVTFFIFVIILGFSLLRKSEVSDTEVYLDTTSECLRFSGIINSVYSGGEGAEVRTSTDYLLSFYNYSTISVETILESAEEENKIAFLVSNCGPSKESDFDEINSTLKPDWYKTCIFGCPSCSWFNEKGINYDFNDLMENLTYYDTVYLEDPHITSNVESTKQTLADWVYEGNALVLSEHLQYLFWPSYVGDFSFANAIIHQRSSSWRGWYDVNVTSENEAYNLVIGENMEVEERDWVQSSGAEEFITIAKYKVNGNPDAGDSKNQPAIAFWKYGNGRIFYFADFEVSMVSKDFTDDVLTRLIEVAYSFVTESKGELCSFYAKVFPAYEITGDILIKNENGEVVIENA